MAQFFTTSIYHKQPSEKRCFREKDLKTAKWTKNKHITQNASFKIVDLYDSKIANAIFDKGENANRVWPRARARWWRIQQRGIAFQQYPF